MKVEYTYRFVTGEEVTIKIEQDELALLRELDRLDYNTHQKETRRHVSLDAAGVSDIPDEKSPDPASALDVAEDMRALMQALMRLSRERRELLRAVFDADTPIVEIARKEGVSQSAISHRIMLLKKKLKKLLT
jgi:RNA polymerase sigma factor (sigma-70 family)